MGGSVNVSKVVSSCNRSSFVKNGVGKEITIKILLILYNAPSHPKANSQIDGDIRASFASEWYISHLLAQSRGSRGIQMTLPMMFVFNVFQSVDSEVTTEKIIKT